jgi:hypothetical protein
MAARGWLSRAEAELRLLAAAHACGLVAEDGQRSAEKTIRSGLDAGGDDPHPDLEKRQGEAPRKADGGTTEQGDTATAEPIFDPWDDCVVPKFPLDILPGSVGRFVAEQSSVIGCDVSALAMACLANFSGSLDHRFALKLMRNGEWWASPRLWVLLVGDPSRKRRRSSTPPLPSWKRTRTASAMPTRPNLRNTRRTLRAGTRKLTGLSPNRLPSRLGLWFRIPPPRR